MTRRLTRTAVLLAICAGAWPGCSAAGDGPPHIEEDRSACAHCGMLVSERIYAAASRAPGAAPRVFDDIACLRAAVRAEGRRDRFTFWFHDAGTRAWIDGNRAAFIQSGALKTPMSGGMLAYADAREAARHASEIGGRVIGGLDDMLAEGEDSQ